MTVMKCCVWELMQRRGRGERECLQALKIIQDVFNTTVMQNS